MGSPQRQGLLCRLKDAEVHEAGPQASGRSLSDVKRQLRCLWPGTEVGCVRGGWAVCGVPAAGLGSFPRLVAPVLSFLYYSSHTLLC